MQQELIEMLEEIIPYVEVWHKEDQDVIDKAEALVEKAKKNNNAPAVPQGMRIVPIWLLERVERSLGAFTSDEGWAQTDMDTMDSVSAMLAATPAPAPAQYKDSTPQLSVGESSFESWFESYNPANKGDKQRARDAYAAGMGDPLVTVTPAQERCSTCGYLTSEREHLGCLRRAVKDLDIATGGPYDAQEAGLTDSDIDAATRHLYHGGKPTSKEYRVGVVRAALRAKGNKL